MKSKKDKGVPSTELKSVTSEIIEQKRLKNSALKKILDFLEKENEVAKETMKNKLNDKSI